EKKAQDEAEKEAQLEENESVEEDAVETWADSGYISYDVVNVRSSKDYSSDSNIIGYLYLNNEVSGQSDGNWLEIDLDGQKGYVSLSCISDNPTEVKEEADKSDEEEKEETQTQENTESSSYEFTGWVNTTSLNVRSGRGTGYSIIDAVYQGDKLSGVVKDGWLEFDHNGQTGYVNVDYLADYEVEPVVIEEETEDQSYEEDTSSESDVGSSYAPEASASGWAAASIAESLVGMPYVWGASSPSVGFDCSGLTSYVYSQLGVNISRSSYQQINNGYAVDASNLQPGDLVFFSYGSGVDHVGMIVGSDGTFVHASSPGVGVVYGNVYSSHYQSVFVGARRIF
ncbi:MAG: NlpC/P60 family protein, partial [Tissierellia bacterium]|nr:NlpC/P60 family protein [Tissierellia bacterium]